MDRDQAREELKIRLPDYVESITQKSKGRNMYVCPLCGSGSGAHGTGAFSVKDGVRWTCFSCGKGGDIFDLYGAINGTEDFNERFDGLCGMYGITVDSHGSTVGEHGNRNTAAQIASGGAKSKQQKEPETDYTDFLLQAHEHIGETDYWKQRGLSRETVDRFKIGYVAEWRIPLESYLKDKTATTQNGKTRTKEGWEYIPVSPRLIIPTSKYSYLARDTRTELAEDQKKYTKSKVGGVRMFNRKSLQEAVKPIFVVEGEIDAMSIVEVGGEAVALGSTANGGKFIELCKAQKPCQPLIIALDNDDAGRGAAERLKKDLTGIGVPFFDVNPYGDEKDANAALMANREAFAQAIADAENIRSEAEQAEREEYMRNSAANCLQSFIDGVAESANTPCISTGFEKLDAVLDGGLYEGLYNMGAISSLGKTTLTMQIADQIAQNGKDVLIFSLEMSRNELIAKSVSRHTMQRVFATGGDARNAKTARGITTGKRYQNYSTAEKELIKESIEEYAKYADHLYISEGVGDIGAAEIRETIKRHVLFTGVTPVVVVDYVQILAPYNERATDKQNTDKAILELKRISRDFKTPVIGISSFNRENYKNAVTMEAFKESGAIEYSSDVLIGLQLSGAGTAGFDATEEKAKDPREIELIVLKNRNGAVGGKVGFKYYPKFNLFVESSDAPHEQKKAGRRM